MGNRSPSEFIASPRQLELFQSVSHQVAVHLHPTAARLSHGRGGWECPHCLLCEMGQLNPHLKLQEYDIQT